MAFDDEVASLKQTSRFRKLKGKTPTQCELKVHGLAGL